MPEINEEKYGASGRIFIWKTCSTCKKGFWSRKDKDYPECMKCWDKPGCKWTATTGDIYIKLADDSPYLPMSVNIGALPGRWVKEARLVMAEHLGRLLDEDDRVFRKNPANKENIPDNLAVVTRNSIAAAKREKRKATMYDKGHNDGYAEGYSQAVDDYKSGKYDT